jgi:antitoxin component of RelBE/YafQ-DinJ toxin-antitoxin module
MSNSSTLTIRLDADVKEAARRRAARLGISLGTLVENDLRQFINGRPVVIDDGSFVPTARLKADIAAADAEYARGETTSVPAKQIGTYLDDLAKASK